MRIWRCNALVLPWIYQNSKSNGWTSHLYPIGKWPLFVQKRSRDKTLTARVLDLSCLTWGARFWNFHSYSFSTTRQREKWSMKVYKTLWIGRVGWDKGTEFGVKNWFNRTSRHCLNGRTFILITSLGPLHCHFGNYWSVIFHTFVFILAPRTPISSQLLIFLDCLQTLRLSMVGDNTPGGVKRLVIRLRFERISLLIYV
jgi:hypothetical protein